MNITTEQLSLINGALVHASNHITHLEGMRLKQDCHAIPSVFTLETQQALIKAQEIVSDIIVKGSIESKAKERFDFRPSSVIEETREY